MYSAEYLYYYGRCLTGFESEGTTGLACSRVLKKKGICLDKLWPHNPDIEPTLEQIKIADADAYKRRTAFYQRCYNVTDIKSSIYSHLAVSLTINMYESFKEADKYGVVPIPQKGEKKTDVHCITLVGWNDNLELLSTKGYFTFVNSWGKDWGDKGRGYLPFAYVNNSFIKEAINNISYSFLHPSLVTSFLIDEFVHKNNKFMIKTYECKGFTYTHNNILLMDMYNNGSFIGWVISCKIDDETAEIIDFYIWPEYRYNGYGNLLLEKYLNYEKGRSIKYIFGWFNNDDAIEDGWLIVTSFFRKKGFDILKNNTVFPWASGQISIDI